MEKYPMIVSTKMTVEGRIPSKNRAAVPQIMNRYANIFFTFYPQFVK